MLFSVHHARNLTLALLCTSSALALSSAAQAQDTSTETVVVTGSRVIADAANSPTPLTIVTTTQLQATAPTSLSDGLNQLPEFSGSGSRYTQSHANTNAGGSALNLRNFGADRTLVLLDGHRVAASNTDGTVDVESLPQMLMQRVDVVTGGASAVYGSDAVTGVVNFVLDKHFTGMKLDANAGISSYEDGATYNLGFAAGSDLFGGRGHWEGDVRVFHQDAIAQSARPISTQNWQLTGTGLASAPLTTTINSLLFGDAYGGYVTCGTCAANGMQFVSNNTLGLTNPGAMTGTGALRQGGDWATGSSLESFVPLTQNEELFNRFSYNIDNDTTAYVQGTIVSDYSKGAYVPWYIQSGAAANTYFTNNAFLTPAAQALLSSGNTTGKFQSIEFLNGHLGAWSPQLTEPRENNENITIGADGSLFGKYDWSVYYTHGDARLKISDPHNPNRQSMWAANDAVAGPGGVVQCYVSTTSYANLYPGCVPIDPFGPNALTAQQYNYVTGDSYFIQENKLDDVGASISGDVVDDWAGTIKAALSMEGRWNNLGIVSNAGNGVTTGLISCTGLRLCNTQSAVWQGSTINSMPTRYMNVWEVAGEVSVPLLKDAPLVQNLSVDLAGRYTDYSTTGSVETWKIGLDYHVNDQVRFRATNSVDIRAPTLYDLYAPQSGSNAGFSDLHTSFPGIIPSITQGNPNLTPEIARTYTGGVVFTPDFVPGLTLSVDYYKINMTDVISSISGTTLAVQVACENSGGTSAFCNLYQRPQPFSNRTPANYPTVVYTEELNSAFQRTEGWDIELNYGFQMADVWADAPGAINLRMVANITPVLESQPYPGAPIFLTEVTQPSGVGVGVSSKGKVTSFVSYNVGSWTFNLSDRWLSGFPNATYIGQIFSAVDNRVNSVNYQDITFDKKFTVDDQTLDGYFTIQNVGNVLPPINLVNGQNNSGEDYDGIGGGNLSTYDPVGRFFTLGVRASF